MLDRTQELAILERLQELRSDSVDLVAACDQVAQDRPEPTGIHFRLALVFLQDADLLVQFLVNFAPDVAAGQDRHDVQQRSDRPPRRPDGIVLVVVQELLVQEFETHECPHALVERLLVFRVPAARRIRGDCGSCRGHSGILRQCL